ncbi:MAG TPA: FkbM family methyltransferase [bacterium]|nr:FkbM family methyltransferase [bacterium]
MLKFYPRFIRRGDLCFDIGANVGRTTEVFLALGARVICVEPEASSLRRLRERFGHDKNVVLVDNALGDHEGEGELAVCEGASTISTMSEKWKTQGRFAKESEWTRTQRVPITTLDTLVLRYGCPAFCKIDVEGFEEPALRGMTKPIPCLSFEFSKEFLGEARKCVDHLLSIGRAEFNCALGETMRFVFPTWVTSGELHAKLESMRDDLLWGDIYAKFLT